MKLAPTGDVKNRICSEGEACLSRTQAGVGGVEPSERLLRLAERVLTIMFPPKPVIELEYTFQILSMNGNDSPISQHVILPLRWDGVDMDQLYPHFSIHRRHIGVTPYILFF